MRRIDEIILHCTATPEGRHVTVDEIDGWHRKRGFSGIGYHFVIYLDGSVHKGRAVEKMGAHVKGHNQHSIGVSYVGGVDSSGKAKDTRTPEQKAAFEKLIKELDARFKFKKLSGHNEYANKACPCFKVDAYRKLLGSAEADFKPVNDAVLSLGDKGAEVRAWRDRLAEAGFRIEPGDLFDEFTEQVTRWFQEKRGIAIDGFVGPQTDDEMDRFLEGQQPFQALPEDLGVGPLFERKAPKIMQDLRRDLGIEVLDAAAILGNIGHECAGFRHLEQIRGTAYGWPQWDGVRRKAYFAWCKDVKLDRASDAANYRYLLHELKTTEKRALPAMAAETSLEAKTIAFEKSFERAGVKHYPSRLKYAERALEAYKTAAIEPADGQDRIKDVRDQSKEDVNALDVNAIKHLQHRLNFLGGDVGTEDGLTGPNTERGVRRFQELVKLPVDGKMTPVLMAAVQAVYYAFGGK